ncbi:MAG: MgtC/SapB family protein, partial [Zavarzinia sp.]|nr:MgtC/SapB family protein [Zavarzinia sp.]
MDPLSLIGDLAISLGCGAVIGFERGWSRRDEAEGRRPAGIRTFSLMGLIGGIAGLAGPSWPLAAAVLAVAALLGLGYWREASTDADLSLTTVIAGVLAVLLGGACTLGHPLPAAMTAVVATIILSAKPFTHGLLKKIDAAEMQAALRLLLISVVVLPVLPNKGYGPFGALNPFEMWLMVVAIAGLSFVGYVAIRLGGARRGVLFAGIFGGLVSSTATSLALSRMAR